MKRIKISLILTSGLAITSAFVTKNSEMKFNTHPGFVQSGTDCTPIETDCGIPSPIACGVTVYASQDPNDNSKCITLLTKRNP